MNKILIVSLLLASSTTHAAIFNVAADFSLDENPNGSWNYGHSTSLGEMFTFNEYSGTLIDNPNFSYWGANPDIAGTNGGNTTPGVYYNTAETTQQIGGVNLESGQLMLHPGPSGEISIVRWTAPDVANLSLNTTFSGRDNINGTTTDVHIFHNNSAIFDGVVNGFGSGSGPSFMTNISVLPGDTIDFAVGFGSNGSYTSDSTGLDAIITTSPVPIPATFWLFGSVLAGLGYLGGKKKLA
jgi:hypothetical protein